MSDPEASMGRGLGKFINQLTIVAIAVPLSAVFVSAEIGPSSPLEAKLQHELVAPCCYREALDRHMSEAAIAMRAEIHQMAGRGKSEKEIVEFYKIRYGARILGEPEGLTWWIGTMVPVLAFGVGVATLIHTVRRWSLNN